MKAPFRSRSSTLFLRFLPSISELGNLNFEYKILTIFPLSIAILYLPSFNGIRNFDPLFGSCCKRHNDRNKQCRFVEVITIWIDKYSSKLKKSYCPSVWKVGDIYSMINLREYEIRTYNIEIQVKWIWPLGIICADQC